MDASSALPAAPARCHGFSPSIRRLQNSGYCPELFFGAAVLAGRDGCLFAGDGEFAQQVRSATHRREIRMATAPLKTRSLALRYTNLRLPICGVLKKFGEAPGDPGSLLAACGACNSRGILNPRMRKPSVQLKVFNTWVHFQKLSACLVPQRCAKRARGGMGKAVPCLSPASRHPPPPHTRCKQLVMALEQNKKDYLKPPAHLWQQDL